MSAEVKFFPEKIDMAWAGYAAVRANSFIFFGFLLICIILPWLLAFLIFVTGMPVTTITILSLTILPLAMITLFLTFPLILFRKPPSFEGLHTYRFSTEDIHLCGPGFDNRVQWMIITSCLELCGGLFFFSNKTICITIPRRALSNFNKEELLKLLRLKKIAIKRIKKI